MGGDSRAVPLLYLDMLCLWLDWIGSKKRGPCEEEGIGDEQPPE